MWSPGLGGRFNLNNQSDTFFSLIPGGSFGIFVRISNVDASLSLKLITRLSALCAHNRKISARFFYPSL